MSSQILKFETPILVGIKKAVISKAKPEKKKNMNKAIVLEELKKLANYKWPSSNYQKGHDKESRHEEASLFEMENFSDILSTNLDSLHLQYERNYLSINNKTGTSPNFKNISYGIIFKQ